jgi:CheY-like chemotaxis protein
MADRRVAVLVDDPDEAALLARLLTLAGTDAGPIDGPPGLEVVLEEHRLAGLVVALNVGRVSGARLAQAVRRHPDPETAGVRVVVLAEEGAPARARDEATAAGADTVLVKPFHIDDLVAALAR